MRAEFRGGSCDGHSHPVGVMPPPRLSAPCRSAVRGRYVRADTQSGAGPDQPPSATEIIVYEWQPGEDRVNATVARLSCALGLDVETD